jgi:dTDP-4-dehydrorhamnose reductase
MKVVVIGSTGQLGQDLMRSFPGAVGINHQDLDVTDGIAVMLAVQAHKPQWILNTAAFHRVDDCEGNPSLALAVNGLGALNVSKAAASVSAGVVFFSTDYVFGAVPRELRHPYVESDAPGPLNVYGASKCAGEFLVMESNPKHLVIRTTGLYGTSTSRKGWTFPELMLNKGRSDGMVRVVTDQVLAPTYTADLAAKVKELIEQAATGLFHLTNGGECSWFDFARETFELAGLKVKMEPTHTDQSKSRACRPPYSALTSMRLAQVGLAPMRPRVEALKDYLHKKGII